MQFTISIGREELIATKIISTPVAHIASILKWFQQALTEKYIVGQEEHGGELWNKAGAMKNATEEVLDLVTYQATAKDQLRQMAIDGKSAKDAFEFLYSEGVDE